MTILCFTAHPDDAELFMGGTAIKWVARGDRVVVVTLTNGATGHYAVGGIELARRRFREAQEAAAVAGIDEYRILDNHTGELVASIENRKAIIRIIRELVPDLVLTHRPYDYHPDHRAAGQLVQDASYIVTVPNMAPLSDAPRRAPTICLLHDTFTRPYPHAADVLVAIDVVVEQKMRMLACHESQMFEWSAYNRGIQAQVPSGDEERLRFLTEWRMPYFARIADANRDRLIAQYGPERGGTVRYAEAFELCEYGQPVESGPDRDVWSSGLFPTE